jgi:hypothetical protein
VVAVDVLTVTAPEGGGAEPVEELCDNVSDPVIDSTVVVFVVLTTVEGFDWVELDVLIADVLETLVVVGVEENDEEELEELVVLGEP